LAPAATERSKARIFGKVCLNSKSVYRFIRTCINGGYKGRLVEKHEV